MSLVGKTASLFVVLLVASAVASKANLLAAIKIEYTTPADEVRAYKLMNIPPNSTGSCKSRFGEGAQAGKLDCECKGGFEWNKTKTQCVSDGTPNRMSYFERLTTRMLRRLGKPMFGVAYDYGSSSSSSSSKPAGCFIKGTVSAAGDKYYYSPDCPSYEDVVIDLSRNEKRFCSEELAENAGWRKSPTCK